MARGTTRPSLRTRIFEELEFARKERDFPPCRLTPPRDEIGFEIADAQHRLPH